ncbi:MAG: apolipoprotein N-acyltransferase [Jatrophihabitantaceae bacterium]
MLPSRAVPAFRARWAALLSVVAGILGALAFPSAGLWPLAIVSVAGLSIAVDRRRLRTGAWLGFLYGLAFFGPLLHWTGVYVGAVPWLVLAIAEAVFLAALGAALALVQRLPGSPVWIASAWVLQEFLRDRLPFGGFPWGRLAFSQALSPLRWFAALGGAPLVSFAVALGGAALAVALRHVRPLGPRPLAAAVATVIAIPLLGGLLSWPLGPAPDGHGRTATVALIQGSVPDRGLAFEDRAGQVLDNHVAQTVRLANEIKAGTVPRPDLVVWPEDASDVDPFHDATAYAEIDKVVKLIGVPVLVGAILDGPGANHRRNAGILWSPTTGPGAQYIKRHPVPFGEYMPLRSLAEWVSSDAKLVDRDMVGGTGNGLLRGGPFPIGDVICFEVAYDSLVRSSVAAGAQLLVVQTNNATFGHTDETYQQLAMSRLRAVETGRTVLQVATTGVTAVIGPDGGIRQRSGALFTPDVLVASVPLRTGTTPAVWLGAVPEYLLAALAVAAMGWAVLPSRRKAASTTSDADSVDESDDNEEVVTT